MTRVAGFVAPLVVAATVLIAVQVQIQGALAQTCSKTTPCADPANCCSQYGFCDVGPAYCGTGCQNGPCTGTGGGGAAWSTFLTKAVFESFFPTHDAFYTYESFQSAAAAYPDFGTTGGSLDAQKRELAAFLGNVNQESGGLRFIYEQSPPSDYCVASTEYPCAPGKAYFGRGPIQLSYNYNYGECGVDLSLPLLADPDVVASDPVIAFKTALWFWMKRDCHGAIIATPPSFAQTIRIINGDVECNHGTDARVENRVKYYTDFCQQLGVDPGTDLRC